MEFLIGLLIATAIGLTGVGGGTITTPLLILVLGRPAPIAVGTALSFAAIIDLVVVPIYMARRQVHFRTLGWMLLGGIPGVVIGGLVLRRFPVNSHLLYVILGVTIVFAAALNMYRLVRLSGASGTSERHRLLPFIMLPVGAEVGFTSAGAGALGSLALLGLTRLSAAQVVGTDLTNALALATIGGGIQLVAGNCDVALLIKLLAGGVFGAVLGSMLAMRLPSRPLKWALAVWLTVLGIQLFVRGLS
ncbi:MAG: sulfite exporter TauE/SafE family protein [Candidatus Eremiobacteraeota bacterium]|nr:sulfite exporter TauE/SafE family protein [Candidatus Eremiobacteraeota bacterium]